MAMVITIVLLFFLLFFLIPHLLLFLCPDQGNSSWIPVVCALLCSTIGNIEEVGWGAALYPSLMAKRFQI